MSIPNIQTCEYPGCDQAIERTNRSKVCRAHMHNRPYCQCRRCQGPETETEPKPRADVREVKVTAFTSTSGVFGHSHVSVSRAPWERDF